MQIDKIVKHPQNSLQFLQIDKSIPKYEINKQVFLCVWLGKESERKETQRKDSKRKESE